MRITLRQLMYSMGFLLVWYMYKIGDIGKDSTRYGRGCPRGVMVKAIDYRIVVSEIVIQSLY